MDTGCLQRVTAKFEVDLHPSKLGDVRGGVEEHLNASLHKYSEEFEGIVMSIGECKILSKQAMVHPYFPYCRVDVKASLTLFTPTVDAMLTGRVIKVGADYIGLLVLGVVNASIPREHIRKEFSCDVAQGEWRSSKHASHVIKVGSYVRFTVASMTHQEEYFAVFGSLKSKKTGAVDYLAKHGEGEEDEVGPSSRTPGPANGTTPAAAKSSKKQKDRGTEKKEKKGKEMAGEEEAGASGRTPGPHVNGVVGYGLKSSRKTDKKEKGKKEEKGEKEKEKSAVKDKKRKQEEADGAATPGADGEGSSKKKKRKDKA